MFSLETQKAFSLEVQKMVLTWSSQKDSQLILKKGSPSRLKKSSHLRFNEVLTLDSKSCHTRLREGSHTGLEKDF